MRSTFTTGTHMTQPIDLPLCLIKRVSNKGKIVYQAKKMPICGFLFILMLTPNVSHAENLIGKCYLEVHKTVYINQKCNIDLFDDGGFSIGTADESHTPLKYFAYVYPDSKNKADGYWNKEKGSGHAHAPLGVLTRNGACWSNSKSKVCAWRK